MSKSIGSRIAQKRSDLNLTTEQFAKVLNVSAGFLSHAEKDHVTLSPELATQLVGLGIKITEKEYAQHNERAGKWMREYRAGLKAAKTKVKRAPKAVQATLPGFDLLEEAARILLAAHKARITRSETVEEEEVEVTPIFKKVK